MRDYYGDIGAILGAGGAAYAIIPLGDSEHENADHTTVTTIGQGAGAGLVFTYSEARTAFDKPTFYRGRGNIPILQLNGTDEEADSPSAAFWQRDDSAGEGFSVGAMAYLRDVTNTAFIGRFGNNEEDREWHLLTTGGDLLGVELRDDVNAKYAYAYADETLFDGQCYAVGATYDGSGGAAAANGIVLYKNYLVVASTPTTEAGYVSMTANNVPTELAVRAEGAVDFLDGILTGGSCGVFFTHRVLTAQDFRKLGVIQTDALNDLPLQRARGRR